MNNRTEPPTTHTVVAAWLDNMWSMAVGEVPLTDFVTQDVVAEHPYGLGLPARLEGAARLSKVLAVVPRVFSDLRVFNLEFHDLVDPTSVVVEAEGSGTVRATGRSYRNRYVFFVTVRDGRVCAYREYANPMPIGEALNDGVG